MAYRQGAARRVIVEAEIEKQLAVEVTEPTTSESASPVVPVPKDSTRFAFVVNIGSSTR